MMRMGAIFVAIVAVAAVNACDYEESVPGLRGACAVGSGQTLGCEKEPIETPMDACWRLVDCGVIHLVSPDDSQFDWDLCVDYVSSLTDLHRDFAFACIEASTCDDLKGGGTPDFVNCDSPGRESCPVCLRHTQD